MIKRCALIGICLIWFYGAAAMLWIIPNKNDEIQYLEGRVAAWKSHVQEVEQLNQELIIAQHFEDLFVMCAKPQTLLNLEKLNGYIKNKKKFCLGNHEDPS